MKFKIGDKVKVLPLVVNGGISEHAVGKIGKVIEYKAAGGYFLVKMDNYPEDKSPDLPWAVSSNQMELTIVKG